MTRHGPDYLADLETAYGKLQDRCTALERALRDVLPYAESEVCGLAEYEGCQPEHTIGVQALAAAYALLPEGAPPV